MRFEDYIQSPGFQCHVARFASALLERYPTPPMELEDLVQEAMVAVVKKAPNHNPERSSMQTFAKRTAEWAIRHKIRHGIRRKRDHRICVTLSAASDHGPNAPSSEGARENVGSGFDGIGAIDTGFRRVDMRLDVQKILKKLDPESRTLCLRLISEDPGEIAKADGVHRSTIHRRMATIRTVFEDAGLKGYL